MIKTVVRLKKMGCVTKVKPQRDWLIKCDIIITESGNRIPMFYREKTFSNLFERIAWERGQ